MKKIGIVFAVVGAISATGCGDKKKNAAGGGSAGSSSAGALALYNAVASTSPKITPSTSLVDAGNLVTTDFGQSQIYQLIRTFNHDTDEGKVDSSNMYKALYEASAQTAGAYGNSYSSSSTGKTATLNSTPNCTAFTEKTLTSPFDFGAEAISQNYDCGWTTTDTGLAKYYKSFAVYKGQNLPVVANETVEQFETRFAGIPRKFLLGLASTNLTASPVKAFRSVTQGSIMNDAVNMNMAFWNESDDAQYNYSVRMNLTGNLTTKLFTLKLASAGGTMGTSVVGYGVAEGGYYLFKVRRWAGSTEDNNSLAQYFCLASATTQTQLLAATPVAVGALTDDCATYATQTIFTDTTKMYNASPTSTDLMLSTSQLLGTGDYKTTLTF